MRRIVTITAVLFSSMALYSCGDDCPGPEEPEASILFQVNPNSLMFGSEDKDAQSIFVAALNVTWKAEVEASAQDWLKITEESDRVSVRTEENTTGEPRSGKITITPDDKTLNPKEIAVTQNSVITVNINATMAVLVFWDIFNYCRLSTYMLCLGSGDAELDSPMKVSDGYYMWFTMITDEDISPEHYRNIDLKGGTYEHSMYPTDEDFEFEKMSFIITEVEEYSPVIYYHHSIIVRYEDGEIVERFVLSGGEIMVKKENNHYTIHAELISNGEKIILNYSGEFDAKLSNESESTYTSDFDLSGLDKGTMEFYGEKDNPGCYKWIIKIETPGYDNVSEIMLTLYSLSTSSSILDDGTYEISDIYPYEPFIAEEGWEFGDFYGSCILGYTDGELTDSGLLMDGTVTVTHNGENNYTITVNALMDNYYELKASFDGDLEYIDATVAGFAGVPYKLENGERIPAGKVRDRNTPRYSLGYTE